MAKLGAVAVAIAISAVTATAYAQPPVITQQRPGYRTHDGFYLRAQSGLAYTSMRTTGGGSTTTFSGPGISAGVAAGGAVMENVVLYGTGTVISLANPTVDLGGQKESATSDLSLCGLGGGVAYYFVPVNAYVAGSLLASWIMRSSSSNEVIGRSKVGLAVEGLVGKEWWISSNWGLGVALQVFAGRMSDLTLQPPKGPWSATGGALLFSATFN